MLGPTLADEILCYWDEILYCSKAVKSRIVTCPKILRKHLFQVAVTHGHDSTFTHGFKDMPTLGKLHTYERKRLIGILPQIKAPKVLKRSRLRLPGD